MADPYDDALALSASLSEKGDLTGAARALEPMISLYPEDWVIAAELGAIEYRRENFTAAETAYRQALYRAPASTEASLGLGWALVRLGRCEEAKARFEAVLRSRAEDSSAKEGIAACEAERAAQATISAGVRQVVFSGHPDKTSGTGVDITASALLAKHLWLAGAYGYTRYSATEAFDHHDVHAHAGYVSPSFDAIFEGALLFDGSGVAGNSKHAGLSLRFAAIGDIFVNASVSSYDQLVVGRVAPAWRVPVTSWLHVVPGFAIQRSGSDTLFDGTLSLALDPGFGTFWVTGKIGDELRPAYLERFVAVDAPEHIAWGVELGGVAHFTSWLGAYGGYSLDRLRWTQSGVTQESSVHVVSLGPIISF